MIMGNYPSFPDMGMTIQFRFLPAWLFVACMATTPLQAATLLLTVEGIPSSNGVVDVALCNDEAFLSDHCAVKRSLPAKKGRMVFKIRNVPSGVYAAQLHHDMNGNGKMDWGFMGLMPVEPYGFSRLGRLYETPVFADAAFAIEPGINRITVTLVEP